jgi:CHAD domain-containing protein
MREFAHQQTALLLVRFGAEAGRTARAAEADAIHDLRVSIRRLNRCLRAFSPFYAQGWKKMRRRLKVLMDACGRVRDRDIAMDLLAGAGFQPDSIVMLRLNLERAEARLALRKELEHWTVRGASRQWRAELGL